MGRASTCARKTDAALPICDAESAGRSKPVRTSFGPHQTRTARPLTNPFAVLLPVSLLKVPDMFRSWQILRIRVHVRLAHSLNVEIREAGQQTGKQGPLRSIRWFKAEKAQ